MRVLPRPNRDARGILPGEYSGPESLARHEKRKKGKFRRPAVAVAPVASENKCNAENNMRESTEKPVEPKTEKPRTCEEAKKTERPDPLEMSDEEWIAASQSCCGQKE
jgi:hypothetical protein